MCRLLRIAILASFSVWIVTAQSPGPKKQANESQKQKQPAKDGIVIQGQDSKDGSVVPINGPLAQLSTPLQVQPTDNKAQQADNWFWPPTWSNWTLVVVAVMAL